MDARARPDPPKNLLALALDDLSFRRFGPEQLQASTRGGLVSSLSSIPPPRLELPAIRFHPTAEHLALELSTPRFHAF